MLADKELRGDVHRFGIQLPHDMPHALALQHRRRAAAKYAIEIVPRYRRKPRVKIRRRDIGVNDGNRRRPQVMVQRIANLVRCNLLREIEMRHLREGMRARIGAPRTYDRYSFR